MYLQYVIYILKEEFSQDSKCKMMAETNVEKIVFTTQQFSKQTTIAGSGQHRMCKHVIYPFRELVENYMTR